MPRSRSPIHSTPSVFVAPPLAAALVLSSLAGCTRPTPLAESAAPARNLVILCLDTLRADHLGAYGYSRDTTPRIDALASTGVLFEQVLAHSNWTVPATASLLTSLYPSEHGAGIDGEVRLLAEEPPAQIRKGVRTLGQLLDDAGFRTGLFSANPYLYGRFKLGFDAAEVSWTDATQLTDAALHWLGQAPDERFFLYLQYMDLHHPIQPPEPYFNYFKVDGEGHGREHTTWSYGQQADLADPRFLRFRDHRIALYDGALRYIDAEIGRLLDHLRALGVADKTLIIVTADHGEEFWDHAEIERTLGGDPRGYWGIGHGHSMFQELLRVPLIFHGPGVASARTDCRVRHLDVAPTVMELLGLAPLPDMRGRSLVRLLTGDRARECEAVPQLGESPAYGPDSSALVWKDHKLIVRSDGVALLYDLRRDPGELHDLAGQKPKLVAGLRSILEREQAGADAGESQPLAFDEETKRQLRALGYLE